MQYFGFLESVNVNDRYVFTNPGESIFDAVRGNFGENISIDERNEILQIASELKKDTSSTKEFILNFVDEISVIRQAWISTISASSARSFPIEAVYKSLHILIVNEIARLNKFLLICGDKSTFHAKSSSSQKNILLSERFVQHKLEALKKILEIEAENQ